MQFILMKVCLCVLVTASMAVGAVGAPISLSSGPQLFIDDYLIASQTGLTRTVNSPTRRREPIVNGVDDHNMTPYFSVLRDPGTNTFRLWYNVAGQHLAYMESPDGIQWNRPPYVLADPGSISYGASVIDDGPGFSNPAARYKFAWWGKDQGDGVHIAASPDGIAWTSIAPGPVLVTNHDIISIFRDPLRQQYIASASRWSPTVPDLREPTQSVSKDLTNWSTPSVVITSDSRDQGVTQFYGMSGLIARGDLLIGMLKVLRDDVNAEGAPAGAYGIGYTVLTWSRDGVNWQRDTQPFIDRSSVIGDWDHAMAWGGSQLIVGDKTYIYYGGYKWGHKTNRDTERQIGLATMGVDRYVARKAGDTPGSLLTPAFVSDADTLTLNALVDGELKVRVLDQNGQPLQGFGWDDFIPIRGDSVSHAAQWAREFSALKGIPIELEFSLINGQLHGFDLVTVPEPSTVSMSGTAGLIALVALVLQHRRASAYLKGTHR